MNKWEIVRDVCLELFPTEDLLWESWGDIHAAINRHLQIYFQSWYASPSVMSRGIQAAVRRYEHQEEIQRLTNEINRHYNTIADLEDQREELMLA